MGGATRSGPTGALDVATIKRRIGGIGDGQARWQGRTGHRRRRVDRARDRPSIHRRRRQRGDRGPERSPAGRTRRCAVRARRSGARDRRRRHLAASVAALVEQTTDALGRIDILFTCAGVLVAGSVTETSLADWQRTLAVNLTGPFLASISVVPVMIANGGGSIVHMSSTAGLVGETPSRRTARARAAS